MKHAASRALHAYWDRLRGARAAPDRADLDPGAIRSLLGDVYLLELGMPRQFTIRLAGTRLCTLFCRELKGASLDSLFAAADRGEIADLVSEVTGSVIPMVAGISGETATGQTIDLELMALPLQASRPHPGPAGGLAGGPRRAVLGRERAAGTAAYRLGTAPAIPASSRYRPMAWITRKGRAPRAGSRSCPAAGLKLFAANTPKGSLRVNHRPIRSRGLLRASSDLWQRARASRRWFCH